MTLDVVGLMKRETGLPLAGGGETTCSPGLLAERCRPALPGGGVLLGAGEPPLDGSSIEIEIVGEALELLLEADNDFLWPNGPPPLIMMGDDAEPEPALPGDEEKADRANDARCASA